MTKYKNLYCIYVYSIFHLSLYMRKLFSFLIICLFGMTILLPSVDASVRIRTRTPSYQANTHYYQTTQNYNSAYYKPHQNQSVVYYGNPYTVQNWTTTRTYYFSSTYLQWYTYYSTPTPGYYYYLPVTNNGIIQVQPSSNQTYWQQNQYYTPQNYAPGTSGRYPTQGQYYYPQNYGYVITVAAYPWCNKANILVGGQEWSACNSTDRSKSSSNQSWWFFGGDVQSTFLSYNGMGNSLAWQGKQSRASSWYQGACASGYRLPTRGEWETAIFYARQNNRSVATLLDLAYNGAFYGYRDSAGNVTLSARADVNWAYWTSTTDGSTPTILHLASWYAWYRTDGTDYVRNIDTTRWQYSDTGLALVASNYSELANVRCIKN